MEWSTQRSIKDMMDKAYDEHDDTFKIIDTAALA